MLNRVFETPLLVRIPRLFSGPIRHVRHVADMKTSRT